MPVNRDVLTWPNAAKASKDEHNTLRIMPLRFTKPSPVVIVIHLRRGGNGSYKLLTDYFVSPPSLFASHVAATCSTFVAVKTFDVSAPVSVTV